MTYISFYRKWRPQSFSQLVGQDHIAKTLANSITAGRVGHAYLFAGPRGTGKTSTAKILAMSVNCTEGPTPEPCGRCESCKSIAAGTSMDVIEMDAASNRGIDEIRDLRDKVAFAAATAGSRKVYIIDEVHMLTEPAFNALLKTLEEPPVHVVFVLATTDPNKVPVTITSRCQHFEFRRIPTPALVERLKKIAGAEKILISEDALLMIARQAEGGLRDAIGMLDQVAGYADREITPIEVSKFFGLVESALVEEAVDLIISGRVGNLFEFIESLTANGRDLRQFAGALLHHLRNLLILLHVPGIENQRQLVDADDEALARLSLQAEALGVARVRSFLAEAGRLYSSWRTAAEPRLALELSLISMVRGEELALEALGARIERLERLYGTSGEQPIVEPEPAAGSPEKPAGRPAPKSKTKKSTGAISIDDIKAVWPDILKKAKVKKFSLCAFLIEGRPDSITDGCLDIVFPAKSGYACRELGKEPHAKLFREILAESLGVDLNVATSTSDTAPELEQEIEPSPLPEPNESPATAPPDEGPVKGDDVLSLIKESFGAEVVEEK